VLYISLHLEDRGHWVDVSQDGERQTRCSKLADRSSELW
jgi:hypothetical protein